MAMVIMTYDLPTEDQIGAYNAWAKEVIPAILGQPGLREFRAYRNPFLVTPEVMTCLGFDSLTSCLKYVESEFYATNAAKTKALGCRNFSVQLWATSPFTPEPLKPPST